MNPIEHIWDALGRRVAGRQPPPQTLQELERALLEEWDRILQLGINSLIDSMPQSLPPKILLQTCVEREVFETKVQNRRCDSQRAEKRKAHFGDRKHDFGEKRAQLSLKLNYPRAFSHY
ncbi:transposable element Tcb2 transposase [Trichonephila clavipes]|nr:transposable element Tcb2 transposase [Trichonephila clavipes]